MLWLCLHFPLLPLEVFTRGAPAPGPLAVAEGRGGRPAVHLASAEAEASGVRAGMGLAAAQALATGLAVRERDEAAEAKALAAVASWAGQFTPAVSLTASGALLEVEGSLGFFGGLEELEGRVGEGLRALGYRVLLSLAPVPLAAEFLARTGRRSRITRLEDLPAALAPLPLTVLPLPEAAVAALRGVGLWTMGDLLALPRPGLARRFGRGLPDLLDRALGRVPDPRPPFVPPPRFESSLELPAETGSVEGLLFAAHRLLLELEGFLRARGSGALGFALDLFHLEREPTRLRVGLAAPGRDPKRLLGLLRECLERTPLAAPATALRLSAPELGALAPRDQDLFERTAEAALDGARLIERLRARLGEEAVRGLELAADHRPERAFRWVLGREGGPHSAEHDAGSLDAARPKGSRRSRREGACSGSRTVVERPCSAPGASSPRPLWLLPEPLSLPAGICLLAGPERIETGWWDGADVARDYYVAEDTGGSRLWVFRERRGDRRWFVHGVFG